LKPSEALRLHRDEICRIVEFYRGINVMVFGSVLHGRDTEGSDLDLLIDPGAEMTMFDIGAIRHELIKLLGVDVDVLTPRALPERIRALVLAEARLI
jgi:predicted nucleotidyltransferase